LFERVGVVLEREEREEEERGRGRRGEKQRQVRDSCDKMFIYNPFSFPSSVLWYNNALQEAYK
jgi:hypothetical protein